MDLVTLGRTLGFSFAAGVNLYATVAILGLAARYGWVDLPEQFQTFNHPAVIGAAIVMYVIEFFADKIPYVDSLWDLIHTAIRPVGGALVAVATLGDASTPVEGLVALLGGTVAASSHLTKTSTRAVELDPELRRGSVRRRPGISRVAASHRRTRDCGDLDRGDPLFCSGHHPHGATVVRPAFGPA
jgi:hypothetical protein